jgi:hypothetical protein
MISFTQHPRLWLKLQAMTLRFRIKEFFQFRWVGYPQRYILRYPILVITILHDYRLRRKGIRPDAWHPADAKLMAILLKRSLAKGLEGSNG